MQIWPYSIALIAWGYGTRNGTVCTRYFDGHRLLFVVNRRSSGRRHLARGAERAGPGYTVWWHCEAPDRSAVRVRRPIWEAQLAAIACHGASD